MNDLRIVELMELAAVEGFDLPLPADLIVWFEDRGCVVNLITGEVEQPVVGMPMLNARAVSYLLADAVGVVTL